MESLKHSTLNARIKRVQNVKAYEIKVSAMVVNHIDRLGYDTV